MRYRFPLSCSTSRLLPHSVSVSLSFSHALIPTSLVYHYCLPRVHKSEDSLGLACVSVYHEYFSHS